MRAETATVGGSVHLAIGADAEDLRAVVPIAAAAALRHKLDAPRGTGTVIRRRRLCRALDAATTRRVTLLAAPPGAGKSVLLADWVSRQTRARWAWLSLDTRDNDPARFWLGLVHAVRRAGHDVGARTLAMVATTNADPVAVAACWVDELIAAPELATVIVDDFHVITDPRVRAAVAFLADAPRFERQLVIASRVDPNLPLHRWRMQDELCEIRQRELDFDRAETQQFLVECHGVRLDDDGLDRLVAETEGWPAGVQMAGLLLRADPDPTGLFDRLLSGHRPLLDFLAGEVLDLLDPDRREFLRGAAAIGSFNAVLLDAALQRADSAAVLDHVRAANLFLVPLDDRRGWYRFHHLFGEYLRNELRGLDPAGERAVLARAADWEAAEGLHEVAIWHFAAAREHDRALAVIEPLLSPHCDAVRTETIRGWLTLFPDVFFASSPRHALGAANMAVVSGDPLGASRWLAMIGDGELVEPAFEVRVRAVRARTAYLLGRADDVITESDRILELDDDDLPVTAVVPLVLLTRADAHALRGELDRAAAATDAAAAHRRRDVLIDDVDHPSARAWIEFSRGHLRAAHDYAETSRARRANGDSQGCYSLGDLLTLVGLALEADRLDAAEAHVLALLDIARQRGAVPEQVLGEVFRMDIARCRGAFAAAEDALSRARRTAQAVGMPAALHDHVCRGEAVLALARGDLLAARRVADQLAPPRRERVMARADLADDQPARGHDRLAATDVTGWSLRERLVRELDLAVLAEAGGDRADGAAHLETALALAEPEGYHRTIFDAGGDIDRLLVVAVGRRHSRYIDMLASCVEPGHSRIPPSPATLAEALTPAEQRVLFYLASGLSLGELARHLGVTRNTLKSHLKHVYRKLAVSTRAEALTRSRELGLR